MSFRPTKIILLFRNSTFFSFERTLKSENRYLNGTMFIVSETKDPCATLNCTLGSKCVRSRDGRTAKCECLDSCPNVGDHDGSGPVCGTDGIDYPTLCDLNRVACSKTVNITVAFRGKCGKFLSLYPYQRVLKIKLNIKISVGSNLDLYY